MQGSQFTSANCCCTSRIALSSATGSSAANRSLRRCLTDSSTASERRSRWNSVSDQLPRHLRHYPAAPLLGSGLREATDTAPVTKSRVNACLAAEYEQWAYIKMWKKSTRKAPDQDRFGETVELGPFSTEIERIVQSK